MIAIAASTHRWLMDQIRSSPDVGANVGLYSVPMASIGDPMGFGVVALEPNPATATRLRTNLASYRRASVLQAVPSSGTGTQMCEVANSSVTFQLTATSASHLRALVDVQTIRLDEMPGPWIVKIDVEGHEREVLDGLCRRFEDNTIAAVMIDGFSDPSIPSRLEGVGFRLLNGRTRLPYEEHVDFNLLAIRDLPHE